MWLVWLIIDKQLQNYYMSGDRKFIVYLIRQIIDSVSQNNFINRKREELEFYDSHMKII